MSKAPIIAATYVEWKMVKTRKVLQLVFELPLEQQQDVLTRLGAPRPDRDDWYGIVRLKHKPPGPINTDDMIVDEEPTEPPAPRQEGSRPPDTAAFAPQADSGPGGAIQGLVRPDAERRRYAAFLRSVRDYPKNPDFQRWVARKIKHTIIDGEKEAGEYIKWWCGIDTRLDIQSDEIAHEKFLEMEAEFNAETPGRLAERRG